MTSVRVFQRKYLNYLLYQGVDMLGFQEMQRTY